ncbi:MAG: outer membrane lipoprotein-sorting protein, partial [Gammaproteobacteria bacterium]|nr:outer membrane lipoprotein-sorting protein [Gemmatimonadota bacterium]NIU79651.1 outer membrane lipoprotein-sorting protein [Gammaproteobacteria bacterium]
AWVVESTPAPSAEETAYGRRELWIDRERHVLLRARFYDRDGNLVKRLTASGIQRLAGTDRWRPHRLVMEDVQAGTRTVLDFSEYAIDE